MTSLWFGNTSKFMSLPAPDLPFSNNPLSFSETFGSEGGGYFAHTSQGESKQYQFAFNMATSAEIRKYRQFKQGSFGSGLINFAHPFAYETNLFSPVWAEPGLIEGGDWESNYDSTPTFANVSANSYNQPLRKAVYTITQTANTAPAYQSSRFIIPIPPTHTLRLGCSGAATGTAVVHVIAHNIAAGTTAESDLTLLTDTSSTRLNASFAGSAYDYVAVDFRRTTSASSTLTITSMLAQLWLTAVTPTLTGNHVPGDGHTGLRFAGQTFGLEDRLLTSGENFTSAAFSLVEVGAWLQ